MRPGPEEIIICKGMPFVFNLGHRCAACRWKEYPTDFNRKDYDGTKQTGRCPKGYTSVDADVVYRKFRLKPANPTRKK